MAPTHQELALKPTSTASLAQPLWVPPHPFYIVVALLYGLVLSVVIPPLQSPDEAAHLTQAAVISHGSLLGRSADGTVPGGQIDTQFPQFFDHFGRLRGQANQLSPAVRASANAMQYSGKTDFAATPATAYYLPVVYFPQAIGLTLGRWSNLSVDSSIQLARAFAFLTSFVILIGAISLYQPNMFVLTMLLMPMFLFQIACSGIDGITTAIAMFALGFFMRSTDKSWRPPLHITLGFALALLVVATTRQHLAPMLLLPFFLYFLRLERRFGIMGVTLVLLTFAWTGYVMNSTRGAAPGVSVAIAHYLNTPVAVFEMLKATIFNLANLRDYINAFIGILGWLDTPMQPWFYKAAGGLTLIAVALTLNLKTVRANWPARSFLLGLSVVSSLLVFIIMMLVWTKLPATQIEGVQGRYFIVPALMFGYALSSTNAVSHNERINTKLLWCFALLTAANTIYVVVNRHYVFQ